MLAIRGSYRAILATYVLTMAAALLLAYPPPQEVPPEGKDVGTAGVVFGYVLLATAVFLLLIKFFPKAFKYLVLALELFFLFTTTAVIVISYDLPLILPFFAVAARLLWRDNLAVQNVSAAVITSVATAVVGNSLDPAVAVFLLAILSVYDCVSVFVTKHMVLLAKALSTGGPFQKKGTKIHLLGAGDIAVPGVLAVSLLKVSPAAAVAAAVGACLGLAYTVELAKKWGRVLPALPTIALCELTFTAVGLALLWSP